MCSTLLVVSPKKKKQKYTAACRRQFVFFALLPKEEMDTHLGHHGVSTRVLPIVLLHCAIHKRTFPQTHSDHPHTCG